MSDKKDEDNVEYFPGKPGFYKKGPGKFKISFGTLDEIVEKVEEAKGLKPVPEEDEPA